MKKYILEIWKIDATGATTCHDPFLKLPFDCIPSHVELIKNTGRTLAWEHRPVIDCAGYHCYIYNTESYSSYLTADEAVGSFEVLY